MCVFTCVYILLLIIAQFTNHVTVIFITASNNLNNFISYFLTPRHLPEQEEESNFLFLKGNLNFKS